MNDRIIDKEITGYFPICNKCKHHNGGLTCDAFEIIPDVILSGENNHSQPLQDQKNKIVFELKE